ncbi:hypothetical protein F4678DRAFT_435052 [Xylaria arbuscula]|nr:hypothetical protein F4678DRAFT_435052 [Xylaria arbuscula]
MSSSTRFAQLRQLVLDQSLTPEEIRYLKFLLPDTHPDPIIGLPVEIVVLVVLQLQLDEFACCLRVSKGWRERFLSHAVMAAYAKRRWPALIKGTVNQSNFLSTLRKLGWADYTCNSQPPEPERVRWDKSAHYQLDPIFHDQSTNVPGAYRQYSSPGDAGRDPHSLYSSGKLAWHLCSCVVVLDSLVSKTRKVLTPPSGTMYGSALQLQALGSRLAIASIDRLLIAWDHVNNEAYEKSLPSRILRCRTQDDRVAILLHGGDVLIWILGHSLLQLDVSLDSGRLISEARLDTFFDARDSNILYLASAILDDMDGQYIIRVTVQEFSVKGHPLASWSHEHLSPWQYKSFYHWSDPIAVAQRVSMVEYEFDHSYIFISGGWSLFVTVFDKIERTFHDMLDREDQLFSRWIGPGGGDLDFQVLPDLFSYKVTRPYPRLAEDPYEDTTS